MEDVIRSEGKCVYCDKTFAQGDMGKHLKTHFIASEKAHQCDEKAFHISIDAGNMFLHILLKGNEKFKVLDTFLKDIWLECCDHLSGFSFDKNEIKMVEKFQHLLAPKMKIRYDYDFGSTTTLYLKVAGVYHLSMNEPLLLLSRNEPLKIMCTLCKKRPAVVLCTFHIYQTTEYLFCKSCENKHGKTCEDFQDYASRPVINSPRMGVCGYTGGSIDLERDDPYGV